MRSKTDRIIPTEHEEQAGFVSEVHRLFGNRDDFYSELFYSVPNGFWAAGKGNAKFALIQKYKAEGMKSGVPDVHYDAPRGGYTKFVCEMKRSDKRNTKDGGVSPEQAAYIEAARKVGIFACICYCAAEAFSKFSDYMAMESTS